MLTGRNRVWVFGAAFAGAALVVLSWLLLIGPQRRQTGTLLEQAATNQSDLAVLRHKLADLKAGSAKMPEYTAALARARQALPTAPGISDFLRTLQTTGEASNVVVQGLIVGVPVKIIDSTPAAYTISLTVSATGSLAGLVAFLDQLQTVQPRAVLIGSLNLAPIGTDADFSGALTLNLAIQAFLAPPDGIDTSGGGTAAGSKVTTGADAGGNTPSSSKPQTTPTASATN